MQIVWKLTSENMFYAKNETLLRETAPNQYNFPE